MLTRLSHIILAFLVLFSTTGFVVNKHYCQNELKSVAFFAKAKSCHSAAMAANCPMHGQLAMETSKGCCDDDCEYVKSDSDSVVPTTVDLVQVDLPLLNFPLVRFVALSVPKPADIIQPYLTFRPPPLIRRLARLQSFLC